MIVVVGNFFEGLNVESARSANYYGDDFYVWFDGAIYVWRAIPRGS